MKGLRDNPILDDCQKVLMRCSKLEIDDKNRQIIGIIESGLYGNASTLIDKETFEIVHQKKIDQVEVLPFFFLISIPPNKNEGIIMIERLGERGIRSFFEAYISNEFSKHFSNYYLYFGHLMAAQLVEHLIEVGTIKKLRFVKFNIPHDKIDALEEGHKETSINCEIVFTSRNLPLKKRILSLFSEDKKGIEINNLFEQKEIGAEYDTIKAEVKIGASKRVINLGDFAKARNHVDVTSDVTLSDNNFPAFGSIKKIAFQLYDDFADLLYSKYE